MTTSCNLAEYFVVLGIADADTSEKNNHKKEFVGSIVDRYPDIDKDDFPLPPHIWMFCMPNGVQLATCNDEGAAPDPVFSANVLTQSDGTRIYTATLVVWEKYSPRSNGNKIENLKEKMKQTTTVMKESLLPRSRSSSPAPIYAPKCLCLLSRFPVFNTFRDYLVNLYDLSSGVQGPTTIPIERYISNMIWEATFPSAGNVQLHMFIGNERVISTIPSIRDFKLVDFSMEYLFDVLDVDNILTILEAILNEKKIVLVTERESLLLTYICESLLALIYPFHWPYVYVPVLPYTLATFIEAPTPFIIGICPQTFQETECDRNEVIVVNLDDNTVTVPKNVTFPKFPNRNELLNKVRKAVRPNLWSLASVRKEKSKKSPDFEKARRAFLKYFVNLFSNWRSYLIQVEQSALTTDPNFQVPNRYIFNKALFVKFVAENQLDFVNEFLQTYIFDLFIEEFSESSINLFEHTVIRAQQRREGMIHEKLEKQPPVQLVVSKPTAEGLSQGETFEYEPFKFPKLNPKFFLKKTTSPIASPPNLYKQRSMGFNPDVLNKASEGCLPDEADVALFSLQKVVEKIFVTCSLDSVEVSQLNNLLKKDYARVQFAKLLLGFRQRKSNCVLTAAVFKTLVNFVLEALKEAELSSDFKTCKLLLECGSIFCTAAPNGALEFLRARINHQKVWQNLDFWKHVFQDDLQAHERRIRQANWERMKEETSSKGSSSPSVKDKEHVIVGLTVNIAYHMINLGLPNATILAFVQSLCQQNSDVSKEQAKNLMTMITKMCSVHIS